MKTCTLLLGVLCLTACQAGNPSKQSKHETAASSEVSTPGTDPQPTQREASAPPRGRWRLATNAELARTTLWISHLVIRHEQSKEDVGQRFRAIGWEPDGPPVKRTKREALELASWIASKTQADGELFEALATKYSDDLATRSRGGSLGGVNAAQLGSLFLDALERLLPGETSGVIETDYGYHVLKLRAPPDEQTVAGERLVVRYDQCVDPEVLGMPGRTREQALALALRLRASEEDFSTLVERHSEYPDRVRGGDLGVWSTREPDEVNGPVIEVLSQLAIGEISRPLDTRFGFQLLRRVAPTAREVVASERLLARYDPTLAGDGPDTRAAAIAQVKEWAKRVKRDPAAFDELKREHCCDQVELWSAGSGEPALDAVLATLPIGSIAAEPIDVGWFVVLPRRLDPAAVPAPPKRRYTLPRPAAPDLDAIVRHSPGEALASQIAQLRKDAPTLFKVPKPLRTTLDGALKTLQGAFERSETPETRLAAKEAFFTVLRDQTDEETARSFEAFVTAWATERILDRPR